MTEELRGDTRDVLDRLVARYWNTRDPDILLDVMKAALVEYMRKRPDG